MSSRDKILARLNVWHPGDMQVPTHPCDTDVFLDHPRETSALADIFKEQLTRLQGEVHLVSSPQQAADRLSQVLKEFPPKSSLLQPGASLLTDIISIRADLRLSIDETFLLDSDSISYAEYNCGITSADYLIGRTGSILLTSTSAAGRRLSVLPPVHIVIAEERQIVPSLQDAFKLLKGQSFDWSYAVLITGPSRTSDIEKQLVLGAHGPKRLVVIILRSG